MTPWQVILQAATRDRLALELACRDPRDQQEQLLLNLVRTAEATHFGRAHRFDQVFSVDDYRAAVPIQSYDAFAPWIERVAHGERGVLTSDDVIAFEETGGSSSGAKLIPYTASSLTAFRAAVLPWLGCLAERRPRISSGPAYAAISPRLRAPRQLRCGLSVGLPSEAAYLGEQLLEPLSKLLVMPPAALDTDTHRWRTSTLAALIARRDLAFISIYSPTFLLELIDALPSCTDAVIGELDRDDAARVESAVHGSLVDTERLWPHLDTIAAWTDGASNAYARRLATLFPHVHIDSRGVLATESAITVRIDDATGCVPALTSAFIELMDRAGHARSIHEATQGETYKIVLTTPGGLYRYDMQDEFRCVGFAEGAPRLQFLGRAGIASDLVGEKLTDSFVSDAFATLPVAAALSPVCAAKPYYELWVEEIASTDHDRIARLADDSLRTNPQYDYARTAGQLGPIRLVAHRGYARYRQDMLARRGVRMGDMKATSLIVDRSTLPPLNERNVT